MFHTLKADRLACFFDLGKPEGKESQNLSISGSIAMIVGSLDGTIFEL